MPYAYAEIKVAGHDVLRVEGTGALDAPDAEELMARVAPTGSNRNWPELVLMRAGSTVSAEARKVFAERSKQYADQASADSFVAVVIESAVMRVTAQFLSRLSPTKSEIGYFKTEQEAATWLEGKLVARHGRK